MHPLFFALLGTSCLWVFGYWISRSPSLEVTRFLSPIVSLGQHAQVKGTLSFLAIETGFIDSLLTFMQGVFEVRAEAAFALGLVLLFDFASGVYASWWRKSDELGRPAAFNQFLSSRRLRDSIIKIGEYLSVLILFTVAANVWEVELGWAKRWTYLMIFLTEFWSTRENFQDVPIRGVMDQMRQLINKGTAKDISVDSQGPGANDDE